MEVCIIAALWFMTTWLAYLTGYSCGQMDSANKRRAIWRGATKTDPPNPPPTPPEPPRTRDSIQFWYERKC